MTNGFGARLRDAAKSLAGDRAEAERLAHAEAAVAEGIVAIDKASRVTRAVLEAVEGQALPGVGNMTAMVAKLAADKTLPLAVRRRLGRIKAAGEALQATLSDLVGVKDAMPAPAKAPAAVVSEIAETAIECAAAAPMPAFAPALKDMRPLRVLVAEADEVQQLVARTLLGQVGIEPEIVADREAVAEAWQREPWDLILLDVQAAAIDGATTARMIRSAEVQTGWGFTPIVALATNPTGREVASYAAGGIDDWVAKPLVGPALFAAVERAVAAPASTALSDVA